MKCLIHARTHRTVQPLRTWFTVSITLAVIMSPGAATGEESGKEQLPEGTHLTAIEVLPEEITLSGPFDYSQLLLTGKLEGGQRVDVTRIASIEAPPFVKVSALGQVRPAKEGTGTLKIRLGDVSREIPVRVEGLNGPAEVNFSTDVMPVLSRLGCNAGTCHGSKDGQNGFKLSLRGYDPLHDHVAFADDLGARRINRAAPEQSLMLLKATGSVPHVGGQLTRPGERYYEMLRNWIADGVEFDPKSPRLTSIDVAPDNPIIEREGMKQQFRVVATYNDGTTRDVTAEAFIESGNTDIATAAESGLLTAIRRGEAPVLVRYEGRYVATTLTVMGDRSGFVWEVPPVNNYIDEHVHDKLRRVKTAAAPLSTDAEFLRRVYLDLTGLPPNVETVKQFLADDRDTRVKRDEVIDRLVGSPEFVEHWTNKWADLLQVNRKFLGTEGSKAFRAWIREAVAENRPYDEFVSQILTASGSNRENPAASYYKVLREPDAIMENTTHLFLAVRFNCNKCHDHPFERWTQDDYYNMAAFFARVNLKKDPASGDKNIGGTAVEGAKPLYEIVEDKQQGEVKHERTGQVVAPEFPYEVSYHASDEATRREQLAQWITSPENEYFARSFVNRLWGYLLGVGLIEPIDDIRAGNPPTNPALLDAMTRDFIEHDFDVRHMLRTICKSQTYQRSIQTNKWNEDDTINFSHAIARRLPAEVLYDSVHVATGAKSKLPGGIRAAEVADVGVKLPSGFLDQFGRPARESACECERESGVMLGQVMALVSGPVIAEAIGSPNSDIARLVAEVKDNKKLVEEIFLRILNRPPTEEEVAVTLDVLNALPKEHAALAMELADYEAKLKSEMDKREQQRLAAIEKANAELEAYEKQVAEREARLDKEHAENIAAKQKALKAYAGKLPEHLAQWEKEIAKGTSWTALDPSKLAATNGAKLEKQDDLSVFASGSNGEGSYKFIADSDLKDITAVRLELLADERLPNRGPGRSPSNGNYVLTEFSLEAASAARPNEKKPAKLQNAQADFSQNNYDVKTAIDGKQAATNNGWASSPMLGVDRTAVFETAKNIGSESPAQLTFTLDQKYQDGKHSIGRFRISVTDSPRPVSLDGPPKEIAMIIKTPTSKRSDEQKTKLLEHFKKVDSQLKKLQNALAEAKKPRPVDPKLKSLRDALAKAQQPVPIDPKLARLRSDVAMSQQQLDNARLTVAQDLAWALINSPAFLFNR